MSIVKLSRALAAYAESDELHSLHDDGDHEHFQEEARDEYRQPDIIDLTESIKENTEAMMALFAMADDTLDSVEEGMDTADNAAMLAENTEQAIDDVSEHPEMEATESFGGRYNEAVAVAINSIYAFNLGARVNFKHIARGRIGRITAENAVVESDGSISGYRNHIHVLNEVTLGFKSAVHTAVNAVKNVIRRFVNFIKKVGAKLSNYFSNSKQQIEALEKKFKGAVPDPKAKIGGGELCDIYSLLCKVMISSADLDKISNDKEGAAFLGIFKEFQEQIDLFNKNDNTANSKKFFEGLKIVFDQFSAGGIAKGLENTDSVNENKNLLKELSTNLTKLNDKGSSTGSKVLATFGSKGSVEVQKGQKLSNFITLIKKDSNGDFKFDKASPDDLDNDVDFEYGGRIVRLGSGKLGSTTILCVEKTEDGKSFSTTVVEVSIVSPQDLNEAFDNVASKDGGEITLSDNSGNVKTEAQSAIASVVKITRDMLAAVKKLANNQGKLINDTFKYLNDAQKAVDQLASKNTIDNDNDADVRASLKAMGQIIPVISKTTLSIPKERVTSVIGLAGKVSKFVTDSKSAAAATAAAPATAQPAQPQNP